MILGIDLGSTVFKAELYDEAMQCLGKGAAPVVYTPGWADKVEMPVAAAEDALRSAIVTALDSAGCRSDQLQAVAFTSQAQTFTVRSPAGEARLPFISWRDTRCATDNPAAALPEFGRHCSVDQCSPLLMVAKLAYLHKTIPNLVQPGDLVTMLPTWFVMALTGTAAVDTNLAAMSGLYSLQHQDWWDDAMRLCGISRANLPELAPLPVVAGRTIAAAERFGLAAGIPVVLAGNDQTAGAYGAELHQNNAVLITLGTAQVVYACLDEMPGPVPGVMRGPYPGGRFYQLAADDFGACTVNWARSILPGCTSEAEFDQTAASAPVDCHGVRFVADGPAGTGSWRGTDHPDATVADQARAVLVCLTERLADMLGRLSIDLGRQPLLLSGGGSASDPWRDCLRHRLEASFAHVGSASPPLGAARLCLEMRQTLHLQN